MNPTAMHELAKLHQADLLAEARRERLAKAARPARESRDWFAEVRALLSPVRTTGAVNGGH